MITFTKNLNSLKDKLIEFETEYQYNIFTIPHNKKNSCVEISLSDLNYSEPYWRAQDFMEFLNFNGMSAKIISGSKFELLKKEMDTIYIGVREDIIKHVDFSFALIITAINVMEQKIRFGNKEIRTVITKPGLFA